MNDTFTRGISRILLILFFMLAGFESFAQYTKSTLESGGYYTAMTKDNSGNLFVIRHSSTPGKNEVVKFTNGTGTGQVIYNNLVDPNSVNNYDYTQPWGLAVNDLGDVFVTNADQASGWSIIKLAMPSYTPTVIHTGNFYSALAVDNSNNLLSMEYNSSDNTYQVVRYPFGAEQLSGSVVWNGLTYPSASIIGTFPTNIVVDSHDNIYVTDFHENFGGRIVKLTAPGFAATQLAAGRGFSSLAVDASDNFYTSEANPSDVDKYEIVKYTDLTQAGTVLYTTLHQTSGTFFPWGIAAMPNGNIFANDGENGGEIVKLAPPTINVSSVVRAAANPTNAASVTYTVTFSASAANVTTSSFTLVPTGVSGASIAGVTGSGTTYTVTVNTGTGSGTIGLNVNGTGITPSVANAPYTGAVYTVDKTAPTGSIVINSGATVTNNTSVTLTLTGNDASTPMLMAFSIDGGAYTADETFATTKTLVLPATEGTRTVSMRLKDAAGNTVIYSDAIDLDLTAPNTQILSAPNNPTNSTTANFTFTSPDGSATFEASLDGAAYVAVSSPATYTGLAEGAHTFRVRAKDPAGNVDATPATYPWTIDITGPQITSVSVPANAYYRAGQTLQFTLKYNEPAYVTNAAGTPYINLIIGLTAVQVPYISGSGTTDLIFSYTVQPGDMDGDGIQVQPLVQNNSGFIKDALGNDASTTLQNVASTANVRVNTSIPSVILSTATAMPTNAPFTVTATFSEAVTGLSVGDFNVLFTTVSSLSTSDNITYTVLMTPSSDGTRNISLPANTVVNIGGNPNTPSNTISYTYDATAPTVTSVVVPANKYYREGETLNFTVNFSENIVLNTASGTPSLRLTIGAIPVQATYTGTSGSNALTFSYTVVNGDMDMDGIAVNTLTLNGATLKDAATNNANLTLNNIGSTTGVFVNTAHPSVVITSAAPAIVNAPYTATITFSEAVSNFVIGDITKTNATLSSLATSDNITYTVLVTPTTDGIVTLNVAADVAENIAANGNSASNTLSRIYDIAPPSVTSVDVPPNGFYKAATIMDFTVHFSENITLNTTGGNPSLSLIIGSSTVNATYTGTSGSDALNFSYTVVDGDMDMDGIQVSALQLNGSTIVDVANNNAVLTLNNVGSTTGVFVNTQHPSVTLSTTAPALVNVPYTVTATFSEAVTGLNAADFNVTNATVGTPATTNNITYTVLVTPTADGPVSISLPAGAAVNIGDNDNTASNTLNNTYDGTVPTVTAVAVPANGYYKAGTTLDFIVRFSENITLNTSGANPTLAITIGTATVNATYTGTNGTNGLNFSYTVQSGDMDMDGIVINSLALNGATLKDDATNNADLTLNNVGNTTGVRVNTSIPTVTLSTAAANPTNAPFNVTITFSEAVTGLTGGDFNLVNATVSAPTTADNITYNVLVTPTTDGPVSIGLPADAAVNIGDNGNTASNTLSLVYDATAPTVTSVAVPANKYYRAGETLNFTVNFSENIILNTTGGNPSLRVTIGTIPVQAAYTGTTGNNALTFAYTVVNGDMDMDGITVNALNLNGATLRDAATNNANLTLNNIAPTTGVFVNTTHPSVVITSAAPAIVNVSYTATITFSEAVSNFVIGDITTTNANLSSLATSDNITYTVLVTPVADGTVTLNIAADVAENIGANGNTASNTLSRLYDAAPPTVTAVDVPVNGYYNAGTTLNCTVHFSENITLNTTGGNPQLSLIIGSSTVNAAYTGTSGTDALNFSYTVVNGDIDMDGIQVSALPLNGSTIKDAANNDAVLTLNNVGNTANVFVNTQHPTVTLSTTAPALVNVPYNVTVTFSEAVTGLVTGDFNVSNATVSNLQTTDNITYTVLVTPTTDGPVSISLPADAAFNIGANGNTASNTVNNTYDGTVPTVTSVAVPVNGYYKAGTTLDFIVRFSENITLNTSAGTPTLSITIGTATVNATYTGTNGTNGLNFSYTVQSGDMDMDGIVVNSLALNGATIKDDATNNADLTLNNVGNTTGVLVNTSIPTVTLSTTAADPTNAPFNVAVTFSEAVTGLIGTDFNVVNATISAPTTADNITYNVLVTPTADGPVSISLPADAAVNIGDNGNTASNTLSLVYDATAPTVTSVGVPANKYYRAGEILTFTVNFSENIILNTTGGTPVLDLTIGTTPVSAAYTGTAGNNALTFAYTVANGDVDMDGITVNALTLNGATIKDPATNNANLTLNNIAPTTGVFVDATIPVVTAVAVPANGYYKAGTTLNFTVTFGENIIINTTGGTPTLGINIGTATVNAAYTGTNGTNAADFSYTVQDGDMDMDGITVGTLALNGATIKDVATNNADLTLNNVGNTSNVFVNTAHPSVSISTTATPSVNTPFTVDIAFSENVTGFTSADVAVTNGNASPVTVIDNAHYSITVVPTAEGAVTVNIPADVAANIGGNGNTASNTVNINYDITGPTVITVGVPNDKYYRTGEVLKFNVHFNEAIILNTTGGTPYITLTIGTTTVNASYNAGNTTTLQFSYTVVNGDLDMDGITVGTLVLNGATIKDAATNDAVLTLNSIPNTTGVRVNTTNPGVTLSSTANTLINAPFTVTATFSEAVTVLTESDFSVTNATLSGLTSPDNITYTVTVTPTADGAVSIQLPANGVVNIGGNANTPSNTLNFTYDGTKPDVNAVFVPINGYYKAGDVMNFIVFFNENINLNTAGGAPYLNVVLGSGTVRAAYTVATANSLSFSYTVQPGDMDLDGITLGTLNLNGSTIKDDATNDANLALNNVANTSQVFVHTGSPSVQLSTTAATRVNAPFTVTAIFNEAVTGLTAADFTVTNGAASNLQTADNITYTLTVTPAADGAVTIQLPAAQAQNVVSNGNTASNTLTVTYDATAPVITAGLAFEVLERSAVGTQVGQVTATDASGIIQNWTIASDASIGAFSIDANGNIKVADQAKLNASVNTTVNLTITVTDGLNTSVAVPVTVAVKMVNQSPTLDAIDNVTICPDGQEHTIQLSGASAVEPGQTYGFTIITDKAASFDKLSVTAAGLITYQLKTSASGTSTVTVTIKDNGGIANGGTDTLRRSFNIDVATLGAITISSDKGNSISKGDIVHLTATGGTHYQWDNADGILSGQQSATLEVRPMQNTTYHVTASNDMGCTNTADFTVSVVADFKVDAVNLLTPNGDGKNDKWVIRNLDSYPNNEVKIFDRAGRLVYTRRNYSNDWDGTMNGSPLAEGTYYYILTIEGGAKTAKGYITIIRDRN